MTLAVILGIIDTSLRIVLEVIKNLPDAEKARMVKQHLDMVEWLQKEWGIAQRNGREFNPLTPPISGTPKP